MNSSNRFHRRGRYHGLRRQFGAARRRPRPAGQFSLLRADLIQKAKDSNLDIIAVISVLGNKVKAYGRTSLDIISGIYERNLFRLYYSILDMMIVKCFLYQFNRVHTLLLRYPLRCTPAF